MKSMPWKNQNIERFSCPNTPTSADTPISSSTNTEITNWATLSLYSFHIYRLVWLVVSRLYLHQLTDSPGLILFLKNTHHLHMV